MPRFIPKPLALPVLAALLVLFGGVGDLSAQSRTTSAVRGTVLLEDGSPAASATVTIEHEPTGTARQTGTNQAGRFLFPLLQPGGPYTLTVNSLGYAEAVRDEIQLQVGETNTFEIVLREEAIEVEGIEVDVDRAEIFNPSQVGPATMLNERTVESMPILSRNIMDLAVLSPLVTRTKDGGFSVAGQNSRYNAILIDGVVAKDVFGLTSGSLPGGQAGAKLIPIDAVAQYEVLVAPFDVRLSGFTGGVMNAVTRTGTNDWMVRGFGVHRNETFIGDLQLPRGSADASGVDRNLVGFTASGPVIRDKAHFLVSAEFEGRQQPPTGFNLRRDDPALIRISPEAMTEFQETFESRFGLETGTAGPFPLDQDLANVFARLDWSLGNGNRLTLRNVFAGATNDETPNRQFFDPYELSSNQVFRDSWSNTTSAQLFSSWGDQKSNELKLNIQHSEDESVPASDFPEIDAEVRSSINGASMGRRVRAGSDFFAQENDLSQTSVRLTNSLGFVNGQSNYTLGATAAFHDISHTFLPGAKGRFFFAGPEDLELNAPSRYQRTILNEGQSSTADFQVLEWGLFIQNQINAADGLTMHFGIRLDVPHALDRPDENPLVQDRFGRSTSNVPSANFLIQPRWGFNWQGGDRLTTQVRGGAGLFVGQLPLVWLSNAFHLNGLRSRTISCVGRITDDPATGNTAPPFVPGTLPSDCAKGAPRVSNPIVLFADDFKYPQDLKFSVSVDQELSDRVSGSLGFLFNHAINQVVLDNINLDRPDRNPGPLEGYGGLGRRIFGNPDADGFRLNPKHEEFDQVLLASNESDDLAFTITAELRGRLTDDLSFQTGYTYGVSQDRMSLTSADMLTNFGFNPTASTPNDPVVTTSNFDRPHKIVATIFGSPIPGLEDTEVSLLYTGESGFPFSYVYRGDLNGDGFPGLGGAFERFNDLIFVPDDPSDLPSSIPTQQLLANALNTDACLAEHRGDFIPRNGCRAPWQNRLDLRLAQTFQAGGADIRFEADMLNVLNLVNSDWGHIQTVPSVVTLIETIGREEESFGQVGRLVSRWSGGVLPSRDDGQLRATEPWNVLSPDSQWQAQFGVRVTFGRR